MLEDKKKAAIGLVVVGIAGIGGIAGAIALAAMAKKPPVPPENIVLSGLIIEPGEVYVGQPVSISVTVSNVGEIAGSYEITCEVTSVMRKIISLNPGESKRATFTFTPTEAGGYRANVDGLTGTFVAYPIPPAEFEVTNLIIEPPEAHVGEAVTISVLVTNMGGQTGSYEVTCHVNLMIFKRTVALNPGGSEWAIFEVTPTEPGTYHTIVNGLSGTFAAVRIPPAEFEISNLAVSPAEPRAGQRVTISATVTNVGGMAGTYEAACQVIYSWWPAFLSWWPVLEETKTVTLAGGQSVQVAFSFLPERVGSYKAIIDGIPNLGGSWYHHEEFPLSFPVTISEAVLNQWRDGMMPEWVPPGYGDPWSWKGGEQALRHYAQGNIPQMALDLAYAYPYRDLPGYWTIPYEELTTWAAYEDYLRQRISEMPEWSIGPFRELDGLNIKEFVQWQIRRKLGGSPWGFGWMTMSGYGGIKALFDYHGVDVTDKVLFWGWTGVDVRMEDYQLYGLGVTVPGQWGPLGL